VPNLRHDPDAAVVVTEVWQLFVSDGSAVDTAFVAFLTAFGAVDTALGAWHGGHSLWTSAVEQRTQPCGALRKWTSALRSGPGEVPYYSAMITDLDSLLLQASKTQMTPKTLRNCFLGLMSGMRYGHTSTSCILGNVCSCAHCGTAASGQDGHTGFVYQHKSHSLC